MLCRPFGDLSHVWLCYVGPLVTLAVFGYVTLGRPFGGALSHVWLCYVGPLVTLACLAMLCRPFGDLSRVWLCYVGPLVILAWLCCYVALLVTLAMFGYAM